MVNTCSVVGCHNRSNRDQKSFFSIPTTVKNQGEKTEELSERRRLTWLARLNRANFIPSRHTKICSDHFINGKPSALYDNTHPDWAPSLKMGYGTPSPSSDRYDRIKGRTQRKVEVECAQSLISLAEFQANVSVKIQEKKKMCRFLLQGPLENSKNKETGERIKLSEQTQEEINRLVCENVKLKEELTLTDFSEESFRDNTERVKFYTGLPCYVTLMAVFSLIEGSLSDSRKNKLSKFKKFIMTMIKLRLNLHLQDLAHRFRVSTATVSRNFLQVLDVLYHKTSSFIYWPEREQLRMTMPMEFRRAFGYKVAVIIDCFEIFIERPSEFQARAATWSSYKHRHTVKILIGICPQGVISFISEAWGGRTSDKFLTENCGFLDKLLPGDLILADRGFDIMDCVGIRGAEARIPAFTKGKSQLSPLELESSRKIAHLRIHVERVIGVLRNKYIILQDTLPIDYVFSENGEIPVIDKMVSVCSALTNLSESVVPFN